VAAGGIEAAITWSSFTPLVAGGRYEIRYSVAIGESGETPEPPALDPPVNVDVPHAYGPGADPSTAKVGEVVTVTMGNWENEPDTYSYLWKRFSDGHANAIAGETNPTYTAREADANKQVYCTVLAGNEAGQAGIESNRVMVVPRSEVRASTQAAAAKPYKR
jgi:hypothetical protein